MKKRAGHVVVPTPPKQDNNKKPWIKKKKKAKFYFERHSSHILSSPKPCIFLLAIAGLVSVILCHTSEGTTALSETVSQGKGKAETGQCCQGGPAVIDGPSPWRPQPFAGFFVAVGRGGSRIFIHLVSICWPRSSCSFLRCTWDSGFCSLIGFLLIEGRLILSYC